MTRLVLNPTTACEKGLYSTIRVEYRHPNTNRLGYASAFILNLSGPDEPGIPVIVTNKHVVEEVKEEGILRFHEAAGEGSEYHPTGNTITGQFNDFQARWIPHPDSNIDLCCTPLVPICDFIKQNGKPAFFTMLGIDGIRSDEELLEDHPAAEEVLMYGYPIGLCDENNNFPLIRRGITASHPGLDFNGLPIGAVDIAAFPGSSGSPVLLSRDGPWISKRQKNIQLGGGYPILLGVLYGGPTMKSDGTIDINSIPMQNQLLVEDKLLALHLGYYVKAKELLKLGNALKARFPDALP